MNRYKKWKIKYTNMIKKNDVTKPDFLSNNKIYEILYALKFKMILWSDLPASFFKEFNLPHTRDYGIDLISLDYKVCAQVKKPDKSRITWGKICNFRTYAKDVLHIDNMILATIKNAKIDKMVKNLLIDTGKITLVECDYTEMINDFLKDRLSYVISEPYHSSFEYIDDVKPDISLKQIMVGLLFNALLPFLTFGTIVGLGVVINGIQLKNINLCLFGFTVLMINVVITNFSIVLAPTSILFLIGYALSVPISYFLSLTISIILLIRN